jgi:hypothetical protein
MISVDDTLGESACGNDFLLRNYQPGSYALLLLQGKGPSRTRAVLRFDVTDKNLDLSAMLGRGLDIGGRLIAADGAGPIPLGKLQVRAIPLESTAFADEQGPIAADAQGRFQILNHVPLGRIVVSLVSLTGANYYIKEVRYNGIAAPNNLVSLNPYSSAQSLEIVVDDQPATLAGVVRDGDRAADQPYVLLTPWPLPAELNYTPPKTVTGDADGKFQFAGLAPGEYRVVAVSLADRDKLDEPGVLQRLAARSDKLDVGRGTSQTLSLKLLDPSR